MIDLVFDFDQGIVKCPGCGDEYTHLRNVSVYSRPQGEDRPTITTRVDSMGGANIELGGEESNPSSRRGAVVLHFECESRCRFDLKLVQHKGMTFVQTDVIEAPVWETE